MVVRLLTGNNGRSTVTLDHDRAGPKAIELRLASSCDLAGATRSPPTSPAACAGSDTVLTWYEMFSGGCATVRLSARDAVPEVVAAVTAQAGRVIGFVPRAQLAQAFDERSRGRLRLDPAS